MKLIILDNVQLHKLSDDRNLLYGGVVTRNKRKYRPLNGVQLQYWAELFKKELG